MHDPANNEAIPTPPKTPEAKTPEPHAPEQQTPVIKAPEVKAAEVKTVEIKTRVVSLAEESLAAGEESKTPRSRPSTCCKLPRRPLEPRRHNCCSP